MKVLSSGGRGYWIQCDMVTNSQKQPCCLLRVLRRLDTVEYVSTRGMMCPNKKLDGHVTNLTTLSSLSPCQPEPRTNKELNVKRVRLVITISKMV